MIFTGTIFILYGTIGEYLSIYLFRFDTSEYTSGSWQGIIIYVLYGVIIITIAILC